MAEQIFSGDPGSLTTGNYVGPTFGNDTGMQPGYAPAVDADENAVDSLPGAYGEDQAVAGAQHMPNAAQPGSPTTPGQPDGGPGGSGSVGLIGEIING